MPLRAPRPMLFRADASFAVWGGEESRRRLHHVSQTAPSSSTYGASESINNDPRHPQDSCDSEFCRRMFKTTHGATQPGSFTERRRSRHWFITTKQWNSLMHALWGEYDNDPHISCTGRSSKSHSKGDGEGEHHQPDARSASRCWGDTPNPTEEIRQGGQEGN